MKILGYSTIFLLLVLAVTAIYLKLNFKEPAINNINNVDLIALTDTSCKIILAAQINNLNIFTLQVKNINMAITKDITAKIDTGIIYLGANTDANYDLPILLHFDNIQNLISLQDESNDNPTIALKAKPVFSPFYLNISQSLQSNFKEIIIKKILGETISDNIKVVKINKPSSIGFSDVGFTMNIKLTNPYPITINLKNYVLNVYEDATKKTLLGDMSSDSLIEIMPNSNQIFTVNVEVNPVKSILNTAIKILKGNPNYTVNFNGTISLNKKDININTDFEFNPLKK